MSAFVASAIGKTVTGTALAAMSLGGMQAAGIVDLPGIPDQAKADEILDPHDESEDVDADDVVVIEVPPGEELEEPDEGVDDESDEDEESEETDGSEEAEDGDGPSEHALAMQAWAACVGEAASQRGVEMPQRDASVDGPPGRFDPEEACGDKPVNPHADKGDDEAPEDDSDIEESDDDSAGPPAHAQQGKPDDRPVGPPADKGHGRPDDAGSKGGRP